MMLFSCSYYDFSKLRSCVKHIFFGKGGIFPSNTESKLVKNILFHLSYNGPEDLGSNPVRVIPKTLKWYLIPHCLTLSNTRVYQK